MRMKPFFCVMNVLVLTWKSVDETNQFKLHDGAIDSDSWDTESAARWILFNAMSFYPVLDSKTFADQLLCWMGRRQDLICSNRPLFRYDPPPPDMRFIELCTRSALIFAKMRQFLRFGHKSWHEYPCQKANIHRRKDWFMPMDDKATLRAMKKFRRPHWIQPKATFIS